MNGTTFSALMLVFGLLVVGCAKQHVKPARPADETSKEVDTAKGTSVMQREVDAFLSEYLQAYETLEKRSNLSFWKAANSGKAADFDAHATHLLELRKLHSDKERYEKISRFLEKRDSIDSTSVRALEVALLAFKGNQLPVELLKEMVETSTDIEQMFNTYRGEIGGKKLSNNAMLDALKKSTDSNKRKEIWEALKQVGNVVGPRLLKLAKLRNRAAKELGYANYWEMQIVLQEHDPEILLRMFKELETLTDKPFKEMKEKLDGELAVRFGVSVDQMMPWHYDNPFFQDAPPSDKVNLDEFYKNKPKEEIMALARQFFNDLGLPADGVIEASDLYEREGKDQHAFCISIDRKKDVRTLLNIQPTARWMETALHEIGHAVYYIFIDEDLPYNLREANHIFTTEAIAMLFGALGKNPTWMIEYAGADKGRVAEVETAIYEQRRREQLIFARWAMVMLHFEKALYENPDQDLNRLWWDYVERFQLLKRPSDRNAADWASKPHFTIAPVYYHNYLLGEVLASQLRHGLAEMVEHQGSSSTLSFSKRKEFGVFLIEKVFHPGMRVPWPTFIENATGERLTVKYFGQEVSN